MKKLMSIKYSDSTVNLTMLILRLGFGILMIHHGYQKVSMYGDMKDKFMNFMGLGTTVTLCLVIFAELICAGLVTIGLFTRLAAIPVIIDMLVAVTKAHGMDVTGKGELASLYLVAYIGILLLGPGKYSADGMIKS